MLIVPNPDRLMKIAIINPAIAYGQPGQYQSFEGDAVEMLKRGAAGSLDRLEVRYYYRNLSTKSGELIPSQLIITHIPSGHVQPFHTHHTLHETTIVASGSIIAIDSDELTERDVDKIRAQGTLIGPLGMVIEDPGVRHTLMNPDHSKAVIYTIQTARIPLEQFPHDWVRDKPAQTQEQKAA